MRIRTKAGLWAAALAVTLGACSGSGGPTGERHRWTQPGVLRVAIPQDVKTLNPLLGSSTVDFFVQRLMFEPLLSADPRGNPVPMLAREVPTVENGGISRDGLTISYHLRSGMRWSDGVPVSSEDVKWSWSAIMNSANNVVSRHGYDDIARIDAPDPLAFVVHLKRPLASFVNIFFAESDQPYDVLPAHALKRYPNINQLPFNQHPDVTDGPFRLVRWSHGDRISLIANDGFFLGKPHLRSIDVRVVADENTGINLLRAHNIDYLVEPSIATYPSISRIPDTNIVWMNVNGNEGLWINTSHRPFNDVRVRRAIAYAVDKTELVHDLTYDKQTIASGDLPSWLWAADPALKPLPHDVEKARTLLRQAGVKDGLEPLIVTDAGNATHSRAAVLVQSMLQSVGMHAQIKTYPADLLYAPAGMGGIMHGGKFDLLISPWYSGIDPDNSSQYACESMPPNGYNDARYCTPLMEALQRRALSTSDRAKRRDAYVQIERLVVNDVPQLIFWWKRQPQAVSVDFHNFQPNPTTESWNAWQWSI